MKKILIILGASISFMIAIVIIGTIIFSNSRFDKQSRYGWFEYCYNDSKEAFIYEYIYYDDRTINVPEKIGNLKVTGLGGYFGKGAPLAFVTSEIEDLKVYIPEEEIEIKNTTTYLDYVINVPKSIEYILIDNLSYTNANNETFIVRYYINVDKDNKKYYSKDGKLYTKDNDEVYKLKYVE